MVPAQGIWTFIFKDLTTPSKNHLPLCHSVTIVSWTPASLQNQHRLLSLNSLAHAPVFRFYHVQDQRMESISHLLQSGREYMQMQISFHSKYECFPIERRYRPANILSLAFLKCASLDPASAAPSSVPSLSATIITASILLLFIFTHVTSFVSGPMLKKTQGRNPFDTPVAPVALNQLLLLRWMQVHKLWSLKIG